MSNTAVAAPIVRKFVPAEKTGIASATSSDVYRFTVVSYNILAQTYARSSHFTHSPEPCLKWKNRSKAILDVLNNLNTDFLCLQEVDEYDSFYKENMEKLGYSSTYVQRGGWKRDGSAIFYKTSRAELIIEDKIDYNDLVKSVEGSDDPMKRDCVGIMAVFKLKDLDHYVIVANTHLYWNPKWAEVKLAQAKYLQSRIAQFKQMVQTRLDCEPSVVVAGDFNSLPESEVYRHLVSGTLDLGQDSDVELAPVTLSSAYEQTRGEEPPFTNCIPEFIGTLDYILFSPGSVKPVSFLELPEHESPDVAGGLPNNYHPSDHLPIGAEFEILK